MGGAFWKKHIYKSIKGTKMSRGVKILLWALAILSALAIIIFMIVIPRFKQYWDNISFSIPTLQNLDLKGLNIQDLANIAFTGQEKQVDATLGMNIKNDNNFAIPFSNLGAKLFHQDQLIAETQDNTSHTIPANGSLDISQVVKILLNNAGGQALIDKLSGKSPVLDYVINGRVFGIPVPSIKNQLTW